MFLHLLTNVKDFPERFLILYFYLFIYMGGAATRGGPRLCSWGMNQEKNPDFGSHGAVWEQFLKPPPPRISLGRIYLNPRAPRALVSPRFPHHAAQDFLRGTKAAPEGALFAKLFFFYTFMPHAHLCSCFRPLLVPSPGAQHSLHQHTAEDLQPGGSRGEHRGPQTCADLGFWSQEKILSPTAASLLPVRSYRLGREVP